MRETAVVKEVKEGRIRVEVEAPAEDACPACGMQGSCQRGATHVVTLPFEGEAKVGQTVEIDVPMPSGGLSALLLFGLPIAGLPGGYGVGRLVLWTAPGLPETATLAVAAALGFVVAVGGVVALERLWRRRHPTEVHLVGGAQQIEGVAREG